MTVMRSKIMLAMGASLLATVCLAAPAWAATDIDRLVGFGSTMALALLVVESCLSVLRLRFAGRSEGDRFVEEYNRGRFAGGFVQSLVGCDQSCFKLVGYGKVDAVVVGQPVAMSQVDRFAQEPFCWRHQLELQVQQIAQRVAGVRCGEIPFEAQGVADFIQEQVRRSQQNGSREMAFSQSSCLRAVGFLDEPLQDDRSVHNNDHRAARIFLITETLSNPRSGLPQRWRNSSMWRAARRMTSRSLTRDLVNCSMVILVGDVMMFSYCGNSVAWQWCSVKGWV